MIKNYDLSTARTAGLAILEPLATILVSQMFFRRPTWSIKFLAQIVRGVILGKPAEPLRPEKKNI